MESSLQFWYLMRSSALLAGFCGLDPSRRKAFALSRADFVDYLLLT